MPAALPSRRHWATMPPSVWGRLRRLEGENERYHVWDDNKGVATRPWKPYAPPAVVNCMSVHMPEPAATRDRLIMRRPTGHGPRDQGEGIGEGAERGLGPLCRIRQNGESGDWSGELADEAEGMLHIRSRGGEIEIYYALLETEDGADPDVTGKYSALAKIVAGAVYFTAGSQVLGEVNRLNAAGIKFALGAGRVWFRE